MNVNSLFRAAGLVAGTALVLIHPAFAAAQSDALPTFDENYIKFSAGGMDMKGSKAAGQARTQVPKVGAAPSTLGRARVTTDPTESAATTEEDFKYIADAGTAEIGAGGAAV